MIALAVSLAALARSVRFSEAGKIEYAFFLREYAAKAGREPGLLQRMAAWNAALGGPAPTWHWTGQVLTPSKTAYLDSQTTDS